MLRRFLVALVLAATLAIGGALPAAAEERDGTQLALGDSVAFGYNPLLVAAGQAGNADNFIGYPEVVASMLDLKDVNASCPGEATGGFISLTGTDNGCRGYRKFFPLHVSYSGTQLAFTLNFLREHHQVRLVTMDIGANDVFVLQKLCTTPQGLDPVCFNNGVPQVLATIQANLEFIFGQIRNVAHYHGRLVTLSYYGLAYDPTSAAGTRALNAPIITATRKFRGVVADGFGAFQPLALAAGGSSCAAGLLILLPTGRCDVHPSPKGRDLLAAAVVQAAREEQDQD